MKEDMNRKTDRMLYLECSSGISGDMSVATLLDLGADEQVLRDALASLPLEGYDIRISRVNKCGIDCCDFHVVLDNDNHDHDMEYLYGEGDAVNRAAETAEQDHSHAHSHDHIHGHTHSHAHTHEHPHRNLEEIHRIIDGGNLTANANALAKRIFRIIAEAEAKAHNLPMEQVHFHEVGAVDSIVDIVAFAVCFDNLELEQVIVPKLCEGTGSVRCQHGVLPVPVPAVVNILAGTDIPLEMMPCQGEYVTPTGAAIVKAVRTSGTLPKNFTIQQMGQGAGKRESSHANILRGFLLQDAAAASAPSDSVQSDSALNSALEDSLLESEFADDVVIDMVTPADSERSDKGDSLQAKKQMRSTALWKLEADIDDSTGEALGYTLEFLLEAGAREAHYIPCFMKKNRPAYQLQVICDEWHREALEGIIFSETTTIGIRRMRIKRSVLARRTEVVDTPYGKVTIKVCKGKQTNYYPEYDSVAARCKETGVSYREMYRIAQQAALEALGE